MVTVGSFLRRRFGACASKYPHTNGSGTEHPQVVIKTSAIVRGVTRDSKGDPIVVNTSISWVTFIEPN